MTEMIYTSEYDFETMESSISSCESLYSEIIRS